MGFRLYVDDVEEATLHPLPSFRRFWNALRKRRFELRACKDCGTLFSPARICCPRCLSTILGWKKSSGKGTIYSYSVVYKAFDNKLNRAYLKNKLPYILVLVQLHEGVFVISKLVECRPAEVRIGMGVLIDFDAVGLPQQVPSLSKIRLPPFRPA